MKNVMVAKRYAKALYELARETKTTEEVMRSMSNLNLALQGSKKLEKVLFNPLITPDEKASLVKTITSNKLVVKFVSLLAKRKRFNLIQLVYDELISLTDRDNGIHRVLVKTAMVLSDAQKKIVEKDLAKSLGSLRLIISIFRLILRR